MNKLTNTVFWAGVGVYVRVDMGGGTNKRTNIGFGRGDKQINKLRFLGRSRGIWQGCVGTNTRTNTGFWEGCKQTNDHRFLGRSRIVD